MVPHHIVTYLLKKGSKEKNFLFSSWSNFYKLKMKTLRMSEPKPLVNLVTTASSDAGDCRQKRLSDSKTGVIDGSVATARLETVRLFHTSPEPELLGEHIIRG